VNAAASRFVAVGLGPDPDRYDEAVQTAAAEATRRRTGVLLVHGRRPRRTPGSIRAGGPPPAPAEELLSAARARVRNLLDPDLPVETSLHDTTGPQALITESAAAVLVVVQRRPLAGAGRLAAGSTSSTVAAHARCPVLVVGAPQPSPGREVVVGVDENARSTTAIEAAFDEAALRGAALVAVHAWTPDDELRSYGWVPRTPDDLDRPRQTREAALAEQLAGRCTAYPDIDVTRRVVEGPAGPTLVHAAQTAQLLVITRSRTDPPADFTSIGLGSIARHCLNHAPCPVLVVPAFARPGAPWYIRTTPAGPIY
jgi:nucleotide-binding universal stress UspA family protein